MHPIRHKTLFVAAFVFAAGFASTTIAGETCADCNDVFRNCMMTVSDQNFCAHEYNRCAQPINCPLMPEVVIFPEAGHEQDVTRT